MDSESLQGWLLKFGDGSKNIRTSAEYFVDWMTNYNPQWAAYWAFIFVRLIALDKLPGLGLVGVGETWCQLFAK